MVETRFQIEWKEKAEDTTKWKRAIEVPGHQGSYVTLQYAIDGHGRIAALDKMRTAAVDTRIVRVTKEVVWP